MVAHIEPQRTKSIFYIIGGMVSFLGSAVLIASGFFIWRSYSLSVDCIHHTFSTFHDTLGILGYGIGGIGLLIAARTLFKRSIRRSGELVGWWLASLYTLSALGGNQKGLQTGFFVAVLGTLIGLLGGGLQLMVVRTHYPPHISLLRQRLAVGACLLAISSAILVFLDQVPFTHPFSWLTLSGLICIPVAGAMGIIALGDERKPLSPIYQIIGSLATGFVLSQVVVFVVALVYIVQHFRLGCFA
jgi:hypothetical protein